MYLELDTPNYPIFVNRTPDKMFVATAPAFPDVQVKDRHEERCYEKIRERVFQIVMKKLRRGERLPKENDGVHEALLRVWKYEEEQLLEDIRIACSTRPSRRRHRPRLPENLDEPDNRFTMDWTLLQQLRFLLCREMRQQSLTNADLGRKIGVDRRIIAKLVGGRKTNIKSDYQPRMDKFDMAFRALGVQVNVRVVPNSTLR